MNLVEHVLDALQTLEVVAEKNAPKVDYEDLLRNFGVSNLVADPEPQVEEDEIKVNHFLGLLRRELT